MPERAIENVVAPLEVSDGAGVRLRRSIATPQLDHLDPFLLFDHFGSENPDEYLAGFPMHPHRGIETVTYMLDGSVDHRDSLGNAGTIGAGDIQWMTAGSGILHEEMPRAGPRRLDGFQVWVNLPARLKMTRPRYQGVPATRIPELARPDGTRIRVVAGELEGTPGAVREIEADPQYLDVSLAPGGRLELPVPREHTALVYLFEGRLAVGPQGKAAQPVAAPRLLVLGRGDLLRAQAADGPARFLVLTARPLHEPIARYGPFVMNTEGEIREALAELRAGTFIKR